VLYKVIFIKELLKGIILSSGKIKRRFLISSIMFELKYFGSDVEDRQYLISINNSEIISFIKLFDIFIKF
jgi:hypothetical protein